MAETKRAWNLKCGDRITYDGEVRTVKFIGKSKYPGCRRTQMTDSRSPIGIIEVHFNGEEQFTLEA